MSHHHHSHDAERNISVAFWLNAVFVVIELGGGLLTNSIAILSDALHDFGDCLSLALSWFFQKKSRQAANDRYSYGYQRFSLLGTVFLSGMLLVSSVWVVVTAIGRLWSPETVNAKGMLWMAVAGVVINGAAAFRVSKGHSMNERAVFLHIMEDVLGWVAVLVVSVVMVFVDAPILDPLLSIGISCWVLYNVFVNLRATGKVFLQATPSDVPVEQLQEEISGIKDVDSFHDLHVWSLDGETHVMSLHVVSQVDETDALKKSVYDVAAKYHINHVTVDIERPESDCLYRTMHNN